MKKITLALAGFVLLFSSCQEEFADPSFVHNLIIPSSVNGAEYSIKIAGPAEHTAPGEKYPVIYVLDGDENFNFVTGQSKRISEHYGIAGVLVVNIGYGNDRNLDYTPTKTGGTTGGAPAFLQFIKNDLIPRMEKEFSADTARSARVILGHSFGGLFGAYVFAVDNTLFGNYILLSPSLWYDNEITLRLESDSRTANKSRCQLVFLGGGELENAGRMQAPVDGFFKSLKDNYKNGHVARNVEKDLDHVGSKNPNIQKGLDFYFQNR